MTEDFEDRLKKHLPRSKDLTLIVLNGHLLMEEAINALLTNLLPNFRDLDPARPTVFLRLRLVRAFVKTEALVDLLDAAENLNVLRNALAHHLEPREIELKTTRFLRALEDPESDFEKESTAQRLRRCIAFLCGQLYGTGEGFSAVANMASRI